MRAVVFKGNVVVTNLPVDWTAEQLADLFDQYGLVLGAKIERWHDRPGGGQGSIDMAPDTSVDKAIEALNGTVVGGSKITVKRAPKAKAKAPKIAARPAIAQDSDLAAESPVRERPVADRPLEEKVSPVVRSALAKRFPSELLAPPPRKNPFGAPVTSEKPVAPAAEKSEPESAEPVERLENPFELPRAPRLGLGTRSGSGSGTTRQVLVEYRPPARRIVIPPRPKKTAGDS